MIQPEVVITADSKPHPDFKTNSLGMEGTKKWLLGVVKASFDFGPKAKPTQVDSFTTDSIKVVRMFITSEVKLRFKKVQPKHLYHHQFRNYFKY